MLAVLLNVELHWPERKNSHICIRRRMNECLLLAPDHSVHPPSPFLLDNGRHRLVLNGRGKAPSWSQHPRSPTAERACSAPEVLHNKWYSYVMCTSHRDRRKALMGHCRIITHLSCTHALHHVDTFLFPLLVFDCGKWFLTYLHLGQMAASLYSWSSSRWSGVLPTLPDRSFDCQTWNHTSRASSSSWNRQHVFILSKSTGRLQRTRAIIRLHWFQVLALYFGRKTQFWRQHVRQYGFDSPQQRPVVICAYVVFALRG